MESGLYYWQGGIVQMPEDGKDLKEKVLREAKTTLKMNLSLLETQGHRENYPLSKTPSFSDGGLPPS